MSRLDFFCKIEDKYNIALKKDRGVILRFDARNTTKNKSINLLDESEGSFSYALKQTAKLLSSKYKCIVYIACDEINILINNKNFFTLFKSNYAQEICCTLSQELSKYFHSFYKKEFIIFAGRAFSVYQDNFNSYLLFRKHNNVSVLTTYYVKRFSNLNYININYNDLHKLAMKYLPEYNNRTVFQKEGIVYYNGFEFEIEEVLTSKNLNKLISEKYPISPIIKK